MPASNATNSTQARCVQVAWLLAWFLAGSQVLFVRWIERGRIERVTPNEADALLTDADPAYWHVRHAPILPCLIELHAQLDKAQSAICAAAPNVRTLRSDVKWFAPDAPRPWSVYRELRAERVGRVENASVGDLQMSCREVFASSPHAIEVVGPALLGAATAVHQAYWHR